MCLTVARDGEGISVRRLWIDHNFAFLITKQFPPAPKNVTWVREALNIFPSKNQEQFQNKRKHWHLKREARKLSVSGYPHHICIGSEVYNISVVWLLWIWGEFSGFSVE